MSRLSDIISQALDETRGDDYRQKPSAAATLVVERADEDDLRVLAVEGAKARCKKVAESRGPVAMRAAAMAGQTELFPHLRAGYALNDLDCSVKSTAILSQTEFRRVIEIRERQVRDDAAHLQHLRQAYTAATPHWRSNPSWTFGQCCEALADERGAA